MKNNKQNTLKSFLLIYGDIHQNLYEMYIRFTYLLPFRFKLIKWFTKKILIGNSGYRKNTLLFRKREALKQLYVGNKIFCWIKGINKEYHQVEKVCIEFNNSNIVVEATIEGKKESNTFQY